MSKPESENDGWSRCPPETLTVLSSILKRRQRWNRLQRIVTITAAVLIIAAAGRYIVSQTSSQQSGHWYAGISCQDVSQLLPDFIAGTVDEKQRLKIEAHLQLCSSCRWQERRLRDQLHPSASLRSANEVQLTSLRRTGR